MILQLDEFISFFPDLSISRITFEFLIWRDN